MTLPEVARSAVSPLILGLLLAASAPAAPQTPPTWNQASTTGPTARQESRMAHDTLRGRTVLFGGYSQGPSFHSDTWEWNGTQWLPQLFATGPTARSSHGMAYHPASGRTILFGGTGSASATPLGDTWSWDGSTWQPIATTTSPSPRHGHGMVYAPGFGGVILHGGKASGIGQWLNDTWRFDGTSWAQVATSSTITPRKSHAMAYDEARNRIVSFGGDGTNGVEGLAEFDGSSWYQVHFTAGPTHRTAAAAAYDGNLGEVVIFGGASQVTQNHDDTWSWNGARWLQHFGTAPTGRNNPAMAFDTQRNKTVLFGGLHIANTLTLQNDTWERGGYGTTSSTFGVGCGAPELALQTAPGSSPAIGSSVTATVAHSPAGLSYVAIGWSRTTMGQFPLPLPLDGYGLVGCQLLQSSDVLSQCVPTGPTSGAFTLNLPNWFGLLGLQLHLQAWAPAPGANPAGVIVSNGITWGIGN